MSPEVERNLTINTPAGDAARDGEVEDYQVIINVDIALRLWRCTGFVRYLITRMTAEKASGPSHTVLSVEFIMGINPPDGDSNGFR